jgi:NAD+ synthase (glutamine-hydrolysing)
LFWLVAEPVLEIPMKIAIAQLNPTIGDLTHNAQQILEAAHQAHAQGANLLVTTELVLCGYPPRDLLLRPSFIEAMAQALDDLTAELPPELTVLVGFAAANLKARDQGEKPLFNSTARLQGGRVQQVMHKQLLPTYDVFDEDRYFEPGRGICHFDLPWGDDDRDNPASGRLRIGVTICEDLWNDEEFWGGRSYPRNPIADLADQGVDLVINLSASPYSVNKQQLRTAMLSHSASRFGCPIIYANQVGANDDLIFDGTSMAFNAQGEVVCRLPSYQTGLAVVDYDPAAQDFQPNGLAVANGRQSGHLVGPGAGSARLRPQMRLFESRGRTQRRHRLGPGDGHCHGSPRQRPMCWAC